MINMSTTNLHHFHAISKRDDADYEDSQDTKPETSTRNHGKSKVFQCTGYGDCKMVFTRSEHLARHMRKHTGEKPFKCVVPGCDRMFSRFDNMMQHTQTHNKSRGGLRRNSKPKARRGSKKLSSRRSSGSLDYEEYVLPSPPPSRRGSSHNIIKEHQIILPNPKYVELDQDEDNEDEDYEEEDNMFMDYQKPYYYYSQQKHMPPDSPTSSDSSMHLHDFFPTPSRRRSAPQVRYQPYPYHQSHLKEQQEIIPSIPRRNSVLSQLATYLVDHPDKSPENFLKHHQKQDVPTRRLSIQDLANPIEKLEVSSSSNSISNMSASTSTSSISSHHTEDEELEGIDLTEDEFQAIQGFGKFYRTAINL